MTRTRMNGWVGAIALAAMLMGGAVVAAETGHRPEWPASASELYMLEKLQQDGESLLRNEAVVREQRKTHEGHLKALADDAARVHQIKLEPGQEIGWDNERKCFFVVGGVSVASPAPGETAPVATATK